MSDNVNILYLESSSGFSGSANALAGLINSLDRKRFTPILAVKNYGSKIEKIKDARIIRLKDYKEPQRLTNFNFLIFFITHILPEAFRLYLIVKFNRISLIHINTNITLGIPAIIASKISGAPCVCHIRETRELIKRERLFSKLVDKFILLNKDACEIYSRDIPKEKLYIIYDGINLDEQSGINKEEFRKEFNLNGFPCIGVIGRIVAGKGQKEFILAAKDVLNLERKTRFIVCGGAMGGQADYFNEVKDLVKRNGLIDNVIFTGWRNDILNIIANLDILVLPSTTFPEGLPNAIIEAMALSKPVVATNIPGPSEIVVDSETGFLVEPADIKAMAEKIAYLLNNPDAARKMGKEGRKRTEELFDIKKQVKKIEEIYAEVLR